VESAECERIQAPKASGVGYEEDCPFPSRLKGLGERHELPDGSGAEARPEIHFGVF